ncbi:hypothetical protein B0H13DRAFT_2253964 [Mycena leptocephala]|nr:hypothetical protein B0H13DRAFT_2253964 [Mycena leptocephala]
MVPQLLHDNDRGLSQASPEQSAAIRHTPRDYQAYPGSKYVLPTDDQERQRVSRLILQHNALKSLFENRIMFAPVPLDRTDAILDIGTGPGLWVLDVAQNVDPSVRMVAVDIESRLFPASAPKNIEFRVESVTNLPAEWNDTFSLVHQRLLILALQVSEWPKALREIYRLAEFASWRQSECRGKPHTKKLAAMYQCLAHSRNLYVECARDMPAMLEEVGFVDIHSMSRMQVIGKWAGETGVANRLNHVGMFRGIKTPILEAGGFGYVTSEAEYDDLLCGLEREWDEIPGTEKEFVIFVARKPEV